MMSEMDKKYKVENVGSLQNVEYFSVYLRNTVNLK